MKLSKFAAIIGSAAVLSLAGLGTEAANAFQLGTSGWKYSFDAVGDGSGGNAFDIKGMAMSVQGDKVLVALTGGMGVTGTSYSSAQDGNVGWGDLFFNFTGKTFAQAQGSLFGIRFAGTNDSSVATGVYSGVKTTSVTGVNAGYSSLKGYYDAGFGKANTQGSAIATKADAYNYYGQGSIQTSIGSGSKIGDIAMLAMGDLKGLNFGSAAGSQTFGFSFDKALLPDDSFIANVFLECGNDGVALASAAVPEPTTMAGTALGLAMIGGFKRFRQRQQKSAS